MRFHTRNICTLHMHMFPGPSKDADFAFTVQQYFGKWLSSFCIDRWLLLHKFQWILKVPSLPGIWDSPAFFFFFFNSLVSLFLHAQFNTINVYLPVGFYSRPYILGTNNDCKVFIDNSTSDSPNIRCFFFFFIP